MTRCCKLGYTPRGKSYSDYEELNHKRIAFPLWRVSLQRIDRILISYYVNKNDGKVSRVCKILFDFRQQELGFTMGTLLAIKEIVQYSPKPEMGTRSPSA